MTRRVCVITGSRAEYGHMRWLVREIADDPRLELQMLVTGMHLEERFGHTYREIEADGHRIDARVPMEENRDDPPGIAASMGHGVAGMGEALAGLAPDIAVILGDRFEMLAAAQAAMVNRIPIAHLHGGEATEGAIDDVMRHAITKMSHLHFVAAEPYRQRVIQMGEHPNRVFNFGAPGLCALERETLFARDELEESMGFPLSDEVFVVTYHPVTLSNDESAYAVDAMLEAIGEYENATVVITGVNADAGNSIIEHKYAEFAATRSGRVHVVAHLGHIRYLSLLCHADVCIGNSSSGVIEAPVIGIPTVNIGTRQKGRLHASTVVNCAPSRESIAGAIEQARQLTDNNQLGRREPPYGSGGASRKIARVVAEFDLAGILVKSFYSGSSH